MKVSICFLLCLSAVVLSSQSIISNPKDYDIALVNPEDLSTHTSINAVALDSIGFVWMSTAEGLLCYDGQEIIKYNHNPSFGLDDEGDGYHTCEVGSDGVLWFVRQQSGDLVGMDTRSRSVICKVRGREKYRFNSFDNFMGDVFLIFLDELKHINIQRLSGINKEIITLEKTSLIIEDYKIHNDVHWIDIGEQILRVSMDGDILSQINNPSGRFKMSENHGEGLWWMDLTTTSIVEYNIVLDSFVPLTQIPEYFKAKTFYPLVMDKQIWFYDTQQSLYRWDSVENKIYDYSGIINSLLTSRAPSGLAGSLSLELVFNNGDFLISCYNTLFHFRKKKYSIEDFLEPLKSNNRITSMRGLVENENGDLYASYYTGVDVKKAGHTDYGEFYDTRRTKAKKEATYDLSLVGNHLIWNYAVFDLLSKEVSHFEKPGYGHHVVHEVVDDTLYAYEWYTNRFSKYVPSLGETKTIKKSLFDQGLIVSSMVYDSLRSLFWMATETIGIMGFDRNGNLREHLDIGLLGYLGSTKNTYFIRLDGDTLWYGTEFALGQLDLQSRKVSYHYPGNNKQEIKYYFSILPDDRGNFLLGTSKGITYFDKKKKTLHNMVAEHPLSDIEFNRNSALRSSSGKYYFGSVDGLYSFRLDELAFFDDEDVPPPFLASCKIYRKDNLIPQVRDSALSEIEEIRLSSSTTNLNLLFSTPSIGKQVYYSYRISGLQESWSKPSPSGRISLNSFPPGRYFLELKTSYKPDGDKYYLYQTTIYKSKIWYLRPWVQILIGFALFSLMGYSIRRRYQVKLKRQEEDAALRLKISCDLHDDVGSLLSGIAIQSEYMSYETEKHKKSEMLDLSQSARDAMERMRDIVWAIDSRKDSYVNLIDRMRAYVEKNLSKKAIQYEFKVEGIDDQESMNPEIRQNFYLILKESITNIVKHSSANKVLICFSKVKNKTILVISDNGRPGNTIRSDGQGLANMRMRADQMGGELTIDKSAGYKIIIQVVK